MWANIHNLFNLLGYAWLHIFHRVDPHFSLTLLCSLLGSLTVLFMYQAGPRGLYLAFFFGGLGTSNHVFMGLYLFAFLAVLPPAVLYPSFSRWPKREQSVDRYIAVYPEAERTGGIWDPAEYIFNPIKRNYTDVATFSEGVLNT